MPIEDTINETGLPVNSIAMANRLTEILKENGTNCFHSLRGEAALRYRKVMWLLAQQVWGQCVDVDMYQEWKDLCGYTG